METYAKRKIFLNFCHIFTFCPDKDHLRFAVGENYDFELHLDQRASHWLETVTDI
jgi:hypothetical protein